MLDSNQIRQTSTGVIARADSSSENRPRPRLGDMPPTSHPGSAGPASFALLGSQQFASGNTNSAFSRPQSDGTDPWMPQQRLTTSDNMQSRDADISFSQLADAAEGSRGSKALLESSVGEAWSQRSSHQPWKINTNPGLQYTRSQDVSPARTGGFALNTAQKEFFPQSSAMFTQSRPPLLSSKRPSGSFDATGGFGNQRRSEGLANGLSVLMRSSGETSKINESMHPWADGGSVQSPLEERRSNSTSEYNGTPSAGPSRNGSLPPSRHGSEQLPFVTALESANATTLSFMSRGHNTSHSQTHGRPAHHRLGSQQTDAFSGSFSNLGLGLPSNSSPSGTISKPTLNGTGTASHPRDSFSHHRHTVSELPNTGNAAQTNGAVHLGATSYPFNNTANFPAMFSTFRNGDRNAITPNINELRSQSYFSAHNTPPTFDVPYRGDPHSYSSHSHPATLTRKLQHLQQELQQPSQSPLNAPGAPAALRSQYASFQSSPHTVPGTLSVGAITPNYYFPGSGIQGRPPPVFHQSKDLQHSPQEYDGTAYRSHLLEQFRLEGPKSDKRYELKDIFDHIVEFSGDQYGSRFIQRKIETANSDEKARVFQELSPNAAPLMQDVFGNYVIQKMFEHGDQVIKRKLADKMKGLVLELSLGMYGCRVVQKALEYVLVEQQIALIKELDGHVLKCVRDQNGNHVIQKAIERVPAEHSKFILDQLIGHTGSLAVHNYGCRVVQRMLEYTKPPVKTQILKELHAYGSSLYTDQYGNYVTQHIIDKGNPEDRDMVLSNILQNLEFYSTHKYASNVVEKCISLGEKHQTQAIMHQICSRGRRPGDTILFALLKDNFGNYVVQKLLEHLDDDDYREFLEHLKPDLVKVRSLPDVNMKHISNVDKKMQRHLAPVQAPDQAAPPAPTSPSVSGFVVVRAGSGASLPSPVSHGPSSASVTPPLPQPQQNSMHPARVQFGSFPVAPAAVVADMSNLQQPYGFGNGFTKQAAQVPSATATPFQPPATFK